MRPEPRRWTPTRTTATARTATAPIRTATRPRTATAPTRTATRSTPPSAGTALRRCVAPVEVGVFLSKTWEREPLAVPRDQPGRFDDLLSRDELERMLTSGGLRAP